MLLLDKYRPKNTSEIFGQDIALRELKRCIINKIPGVLTGSSGIGKTISVYAIANELNYEVVESNSSDIRNKEGIEKVIGIASKQRSLFHKGKIILIDEIEGLTGRYDRGGISAIVDVIKKSNFSVVLTTNNVKSKNFSAVKKVCNVINFEILNYTTITNILKNVCNKEKLKIEENILKNLAIKSNGDARAALIDLELFRYGDFSNIDFVSRDITNEISNVLRVIFKSRNSSDIFKVFDSLHEDLDEINLWLEENLPKEYSGFDLARGFDSLSKADVYKGRIAKRQYYRFLVYRSLFMSAGIGLAKEEKKQGHIKYSRNSRILKMWIWSNKNAKKKSISQKIAKNIHTSSRKVIKDFCYYRNLIDSDFIKKLELNEDEIGWLHKH